MKKLIVFTTLTPTTLEVFKLVAVGEISASELRAKFNQRTYELSVPTINYFSKLLPRGDFLVTGSVNIEGRRQQAVKLNSHVKLVEATNNYLVLEVDD